MVKLDEGILLVLIVFESRKASSLNIILYTNVLHAVSGLPCNPVGIAQPYPSAVDIQLWGTIIFLTVGVGKTHLCPIFPSQLISPSV